MQRHLSKAIGIMESHGNMTPPKEYDISPVTGPKEMEDYPQEGRTPQLWNGERKRLSHQTAQVWGIHTRKTNPYNIWL